MKMKNENILLASKEFNLFFVQQPHTNNSMWIFAFFRLYGMRGWCVLYVPHVDLV